MIYWHIALFVFLSLFHFSTQQSDLIPPILVIVGSARNSHFDEKVQDLVSSNNVILALDQLSVEDLHFKGKSLSNLRNVYEKSNHVFVPSKQRSQVRSELFKHINTADQGNVNNISSDLGRSPWIIFKIPDDFGDRDSYLSHADRFILNIDEYLKMLGNSYTIWVTGDSYRSQDKHMRSKRALSDPLTEVYLNSSCMALYSSAVVLKIGSESIQLNNSLRTNQSVNCDNADSEIVAKVMWANVKQKNVDLTDIVVTLIFSSNKSSSWKQSQSVELKGTINQKPINKVYTTSSGEYVPRGFTYVCSKAAFHVSKAERNSMFSRLMLSNFHAQPFLDRTADFGRPWDCATFFTIPIWSGILLSLIMLAVLVWSVMMLASVPTMDKWDNVRDQTLQINTSE